jgi:hypothetical protein
MLALLFIRETRDVNLDYLDEAEPGLAYSPRLQKALSD